MTNALSQYERWDRPSGTIARQRYGYDEDGNLVETWVAGDMNCDDINPFVLALTDPDAYAAAYPDCSIDNGDINGNGWVDFNDINPFVMLLSGQ